MEILETDHAVMTAYEVLRLVKARQGAARRYHEGLDQAYLGGHARVEQARAMLLPSLMAHSPEGTDEDGDDKFGDVIPRFCAGLQDACPRLSPFQVRNVLAVRPRNISELARLFLTDSEWGEVSDASDRILELVESCFPLDAT